MSSTTLWPVELLERAFGLLTRQRANRPCIMRALSRTALRPDSIHVRARREEVAKIIRMRKDGKSFMTCRGSRWRCRIRSGRRAPGRGVRAGRHPSGAARAARPPGPSPRALTGRDESSNRRSAKRADSPTIVAKFNSTAPSRRRRVYAQRSAAWERLHRIAQHMVQRQAQLLRIMGGIGQNTGKLARQRDCAAPKHGVRPPTPTQEPAEPAPLPPSRDLRQAPARSSPGSPPPG